MSNSKKTEISLGFYISRDLAIGLCGKLSFANELASGTWTHRYDNEGRVTTFVAPRKLGVVNYRIAKAMIEGFRYSELS